MTSVDRTGVMPSAASLWDLTTPKEHLQLRSARSSIGADNTLLLTLRFDRPSSGALTLRFLAFDRLPAEHREYFSWVDAAGTVRAARLLTARAPAITLELPRR
jgi:hypothetical protein